MTDLPARGEGREIARDDPRTADVRIAVRRRHDVSAVCGVRRHGPLRDSAAIDQHVVEQIESRVFLDRVQVVS